VASGRFAGSGQILKNDVGDVPSTDKSNGALI
jgi:hypothetical protein